jgi:hypothetical protein
MIFTVVIQTNSRAEKIQNILQNFEGWSNDKIEIKFIISDNGQQNLDKYLCNEFDIKIIDNSNFKTAKGHFLAFTKMELENLFIIHDDDNFHIDNFTNAINFIIENEVDILISPKKPINQTYKPKNILKVFEFYFLDKNNNCPLLSGMYLKDSKKLDKFTDKYLINGKYADVQIVSELLAANNGYIYHEPFVIYNEHDTNDNLTKSINDRICLHYYLHSFNKFEFQILSRLIYYNYPSKVLDFYTGLVLTLFKPSYLYKLIQKYNHKKISE